MLSAEDIAAVKVAIETCNNPEVKTEVLCAPGSDYDKNKKINGYRSKTQWYEIVGKKAAIILKNLGLPKKLHEKIMSFVPLVGIRMLTWAEYHEGTLGFSREYSMDFLSSSFFTSQGIIDNKKASEELMNDKNLSIKQKYKLACLYCFTDHIPVLYKQMAKEDKKKFYDAQNQSRIKQPGLVKFWSYYLMGETDKLRRGKNLDLYRLEKAIECGNKVAVEYCLEKTNLSRKKDALVDAAFEAIKYRTNQTGDFILFNDVRYAEYKETWIPDDYYVDIFCFLFSKMRDVEQIDFLKKDIEGVGYLINFHHCCQWRLSVLQYFLKWPYQNYFMSTAELMWGILPESVYGALLLRICDKIESMDGIMYGEEKIYDYRGLLKEFWYRSTEHYKRHIFSNSRQDKCSSGRIFGAGVELLVKLLTLEHFTCEDIKNIKMILSSATSEEKESLISSQDWINFCIDMIKVEKWEILDRIVLNCFLSKEKADKFRRELSITKAAQRICIYSVKYAKLNDADLFIKWSSLPEEEINKLKIEMIHSDAGRDACVDLIIWDKNVKGVDKFIRWFLHSEENIKLFKKEFILSLQGIWLCAELVQYDKFELVNEVINFGISSKKEINSLKRNVAYKTGKSIIADIFYSKYVYNEREKWVKLEQFLTWCFSSEEEISEFKNKKLKNKWAKEIHFKFIKFNEWEEAEMYFAWLDLSAEEIKELKKETLFNYDAAAEMFSELMYSKDGDKKFVDYGGKQDAIELLLRWYLTDKETVLEFNDHIKQQYDRKEITEERSEFLKNFDLAIMQRLNDLDEEQSSKEKI